MKRLKVTTNIKEVKFEGVWAELESKKVCRENYSGNNSDNNYEISETSDSFYIK